MHNRDSKDVWDLITNVAWTKWISPIANLWEDIWNNIIELKDFFSHSITDMIKYIEKLPSDSEELNKIIIEYQDQKDKNIKDRK